MIHQVRVIFGDTDHMGVVYYANYMRYFEGARAALLRSVGHSHKDLGEWDVALPVIEAHCNYRRPALYEDLIDIDVGVDEVRGASMRFVYQARRDGEVLADGFTRHACINSRGRPWRFPPQMRSLIDGLIRA
jgi:acyl-CoA thioester hydrolase